MRGRKDWSPVVACPDYSWTEEKHDTLETEE